MYTDSNESTKDTKDTFVKTSTWNEYSHYHDYFIELLSYDRKHNYIHNSIWEFSYI